MKFHDMNSWVYTCILVYGLKDSGMGEKNAFYANFAISLKYFSGGIQPLQYRVSSTRPVRTSTE